LQKIISDRFGQNIRITKIDTGIKLNIVGSDRCIIFDNMLSCFEESNSDFSCSLWDSSAEGWNSILDRVLKAPTDSEILSPLIEKVGSDYFIHYDILGLTYWMLARVEEINSKETDKHGRFLTSSSHAYKNGYIDRPIVDEWLYILGQVMIRQWPHIKLKVNSPKILISHDVDHPSRFTFCSKIRFIKMLIGDIVKRKIFGSLIFSLIARYSPSSEISHLDRWNTFDWLMDKSEENGLKSAFYFQAGLSEKRIDADYRIDEDSIKNLIKKISNRGHEIGFHPSYHAGSSADVFRKEGNIFHQCCKELNVIQESWGGRMHYLRLNTKETFKKWADNGFNYESSLGFADCPGFRCGTCFEYEALDPIQDKIYDLVIRPLIVMDCSVFTEKILKSKFDCNNKLNSIHNLKIKCFKVGGNFTLLWHNNFFETKRMKEIYSEFLQ
jgi:hypothetical protein